MLKIHLGDQTDSKLLLGTYLTTNVPGNFKWQPGVLTTAVTEGRWIFIEDIDSAPNDVLAVLVPLLETRCLHVASRGEKHKAKDGFAIIASRRISIKNSFGGNLAVGDSLWTRIVLDTPNVEELKNIIDFRFHTLRHCSEHLISVFIHVKEVLKELKAGINHLSLRDLLKWCRRICIFGVGLESSQFVECCFREALDCFIAMIPAAEIRLKYAFKVGLFLKLNETRIEYYLEHFTPGANLENDRELKVGRSIIAKEPGIIQGPSNFTLTRVTVSNLESVLVAVQMNEPVLLVGETGTGKTTLVQLIASQLGKKLSVINMSQQSDSTDLLGGFKPVDLMFLASNLKQTFDALFAKTFSLSANGPFLESVSKAYKKKRWNQFAVGLENAIQMARKVYQHQIKVQSSSVKKKIKFVDNSIFVEWENLFMNVSKFKLQSQPNSTKQMFSFVEGTLINAVQNGDWILLDEINLANAETLECLSGLLQDSEGSILLLERGDTEPIKRHKDFRVFGCMNPANDSGKRNLPESLRSRFSEFWIDSPDKVREDLCLIVKGYCSSFVANTAAGLQLINEICEFYIRCRQLASTKALFDGANRPVHYSLRTLTRAINFAAQISETFGVRRSLYEGLLMTFMTGLNSSSFAIVDELLRKYILNTITNPVHLIKQIPERPKNRPASELVLVDCFWLEKGCLEIPVGIEDTFVRTPSVDMNIRNLARACLSRKYPILIQGPTSAGKTSMIEYLAKLTGNSFIRINNHEHTDLQEYIGTYATNEDGALVFQEGVLVKALREGHWIVLDELNLAPTDVLEALNRLLDDNRELYLAEKQEVILPHPHFMLFATQNPAGHYGGRKQLSRAFRNRFLELHVTDIPSSELSVIIEKRCQIPSSYAKKLVNVFTRIVQARNSSNIFEGRLSFITLRDLFRWASRKANGYQELAVHGYMLIAERIRKDSDKIYLQKIIEDELSVKIDTLTLYHSLFNDIMAGFPTSKSRIEEILGSVVWTSQMEKLLVLTYSAIVNQEPVLLIGETGCGKTTICQLLSVLLDKEITIVNAHQNSETSDFLGSQRPSRGRGEARESLITLISELSAKLGANTANLNDPDFVDEFLRQWAPELTSEQIDSIDLLNTKSKTLFEWQDGPLIQAMKNGRFFLLDEISLAEDAVLERLNSVLETDRKITLIEKTGEEITIIRATESFRFFATMNPGGDYGKKELSPALRNRFTEIWVPQISADADLLKVIEVKMAGLSTPKVWALKIIEFINWFAGKINRSRESFISLRDIICWAEFMKRFNGKLSSGVSFYHGGCMVFVDGVGMNPIFGWHKDRQKLISESKEKLVELSSVLIPSSEPKVLSIKECQFGHSPFFIPIGSICQPSSQTFFHPPTTADNCFRVLRALQLKKPILLEGSPGAGKTSLISNLAACTNHRLSRINLSEQTDLMDLFGSDLPVEGGEGGEFSWRDGPFLQAMKSGDWVLLDELNLASQQVLEGLNACFDHRGQVYIPDLDKRFHCHSDFKVFASQNPQGQGGGRKGLPRSFLNRFILVYVEDLSRKDLTVICSQEYPGIDGSVVMRMIEFNQEVKLNTMDRRTFGSNGSPWEFNLRDVLRWLELMSRTQLIPEAFISTLYIQRMRAEGDRRQMLDLASKWFDPKLISKSVDFYASPEKLLLGNNILLRKQLKKRYHSIASDQLQLLHCNMDILSSLATCVGSKNLAILVGPSGSGKSSLVRLLASLCGASLEELPINPGIDSLEILGSFEQVDLQRSKHKVAEEFTEIVRILQKSIIKRGDTDTLAKTNYILRELVALSFKEEFLHDILKFLEPLISPELLIALNIAVSEYKRTVSSTVQGKFEWVDSMLINALEKGTWLLIDNANLCSSSVLDRLNSVLEIGGSLELPERGMVDGTIKRIVPHKDFRIFMTLDPSHGEISRAMRNRGIEVFVNMSILSAHDKFRLFGPLSKCSSGEKLQSVNDVPNYRILLEKFRHGMSTVEGGQEWFRLTTSCQMISNFSSLSKRLLEGQALIGSYKKRIAPLLHPHIKVSTRDYLYSAIDVFLRLESEKDKDYTKVVINNARLSGDSKLQIKSFYSYDVSETLIERKSFVTDSKLEYSNELLVFNSN